MTPPELRTERLTLKIGAPADAPLVLDYFDRNRAHLEPLEPKRAEGFYTVPYWEKQIETSLAEHAEGRSCRMFIFRPDASAVLGCVNVNNIVRRVFQAAHLGYSLDGREQGKGLMTEALEKAIDYAFARDGLHLHRLMANHLPDNARSAAVLRRLGFEVEGYAHDYLLINGRWRDHVLTALVNKNWEP